MSILTKESDRRAFEAAWQTRDTAPKDGTYILVCDYKVAGGFMNVVSYTNEDYPHVWETQEFAAYHLEAFTHWMPLPELPEATTAPKPFTFADPARQLEHEKHKATCGNNVDKSR